MPWAMEGIMIQKCTIQLLNFQKKGNNYVFTYIKKVNMVSSTTRGLPQSNPNQNRFPGFAPVTSYKSWSGGTALNQVAFTQVC